MQIGGDGHQERVRLVSEAVPLASGEWGAESHGHLAVGGCGPIVSPKGCPKPAYGAALRCGKRGGPRHGLGGALHAPPGRGEKARTYNVLRAKTLCDARTWLRNSDSADVHPPFRPTYF